MTVFWVLAAAMVIIALLFTVPWIMRGGRGSGTDPDTLNVTVIKAQLEELDNDLRTGRLAEADYADARGDLERELLDDLAHGESGNGPGSVRSGRWGALLLVVLVPLISFALYQKIGTRQIIPMLAESTSPIPSPPLTRQSIEEMVGQLEQRMREQPDDVQGWTMLARSYGVLKRYPEAAAAYKQALQRDTENVALMVSYADVLAMVHNGHFTKEASALLQKALELQPDNIVALWLSGHRAYQEERYEESLEYWQRAAGLLPADSPDGIVINQQIAKARQQLGVEGSSTATQAVVPAPASSATGPALHVRVSLDTALQDQAGPDDTVFVFARAVDGPRIPLAIVRKQVRDLPLTVILDDSQAMSPAMVLSGFEKVEVGARISQSGNAMPQSGDLHGSVAPVATRDTATISLVISETIP